MGAARWNETDWSAHAAKTAGKTRAEVFTARNMVDGLDPKNIKFRESRNSTLNPRSTPIVLASDVTGSMGILAEQIIKKGLGVIMSAIYDRKPITDPHIMCMAIGDAYCDSAPLQVTQFEAGVEPMTKQVQDIWIESGGGGNNGESYPLAWLFVAAKTKCDAIKEGRKGFLFTIGDESPLPTITREHAEQFLGISCQADMDAKTLHDTLSKDWNIFHLITPTSATTGQGAVERWKKIMNERAIVVNDIEKLQEGIVAVMQLCQGTSPHDVEKGWDSAALVEVRSVTRQMATV